MKQTLRFAAAAVAVLAVFACSKDDAATPETGNPDSTAPYTLTAAFGESPETRISMDDTGSAIELTWKAGDKIYVVNSNAYGSTSAGTLYTFTASDVSADGKTAAFTCADYPEDATPAYAIHKGKVIYTSYDPKAVNADGSMTLTPSNLPDAFSLYARYDAENRKMVFAPLCAVLKLNVTLPAGVSGKLSSLRIGSADGDAIFIRGSYDITKDPVVRNTSTASQPNLTSTGSETLSGGTPQAIYVPIRPGSELAGRDLEVSLLVGNSVYSAPIKGGNLEAGRCYPLTLPESKWSGGAIYESGAGTSAEPYMIENEAQLRALAKAVQTGQRFSSKYFQLKNDINGIVTSAEEPWLPIGTSNSNFQGNFNGDGKTISGIFHFSDKDGIDLGIFGSVNNIQISNLTVDGDIIYQSTLLSTSSLGVSIGGIVGRTTYRIINCTHIGSMTAENTVYTSGLQMGGIVGSSSSNISGCTQRGGALSANMPKGRGSVGGIVGYFNTSSAQIHTCRSESDITVTGLYAASFSAGALAGYNYGKIYSCSTFPDDLTIIVKGVQQSPVLAVGSGNAIDETEHTD